MPRSGSNVYAPPPNTRANPNTTIQSSVFNSVIDDLVSDLNAARPISAGGTGATNAADARAALGIVGVVGTVAEVTTSNALNNLSDTGHVFVATANCTTVGGPTGGGDGIVFTGYTPNYRVQLFYGIAAAPVTWRRVYVSGAWTTWRPQHQTGTGNGGRYERFGTGYQTAWREGFTLTQSSGATCNATLTLPIAFANTNYVVRASLRAPTDGGDDISANCAPGSSALMSPYAHTKTTTTCVIQCHRIAGGTDFVNGNTLTADVEISGEWF